MQAFVGNTKNDKLLTDLLKKNNWYEFNFLIDTIGIWTKQSMNIFLKDMENQHSQLAVEAAMQLIFRKHSIDTKMHQLAILNSKASRDFMMI
jgi:hypothetical protein